MQKEFNNMHSKKTGWQKSFKWLHRLMVGLFCMLLWQGCFKFRTPDPEAKENFAKLNIPLEIKNYPYSSKRIIHYLQTGKETAPTIYFIHGTPGSWNNFESYLKDSALRKSYRLISIDRPGFGYSNFGQSEPIELQVEMIDKLIRSNGNGQPILLVGHSLGGPIVAALGAKENPSVTTLLIWAGSQSPKLEPKERWRKPLSSSALRWVVPGAFGPSNDELVDFKKYVLQMPEILGKVRAHVYLVHGTKDMFVPFENMAWTEEKLNHAPSVKTITLKGENHFIPWTRFNDLRDLLLYIRSNIE
jgi:pimeloyl-ACP methyl ester carboxylesterase